jgi:hypothetical protein
MGRWVAWPFVELQITSLGKHLPRPVGIDRYVRARRMHRLPMAARWWLRTRPDGSCRVVD